MPSSSFVRGFLTGILTLGILFSASLYAAGNGGVFGDLLNMILTGNKNGANGVTWETATGGTVYNASNLGGSGASSFQRGKPSQACPATQCIYGINAAGTVMCR